MKLVDWRKGRKLTQAEFGKLIGVIGITVSRWERGTRVPEPKFQRLMLGVTDGQVTPNDWITE